MLIYLDANIVQYCGDESDYVFGKTDSPRTDDPRLQKELTAIRRLVDLEQFGNWEFAAPLHLLAELRAGKPTVCASVVLLRASKRSRLACSSNDILFVPGNRATASRRKVCTAHSTKPPGHWITLISR